MLKGGKEQVALLNVSEISLLHKKELVSFFSKAAIFLWHNEEDTIRVKELEEKEGFQFNFKKITTKLMKVQNVFREIYNFEESFESLLMHTKGTKFYPLLISGKDITLTIKESIELTEIIRKTLEDLLEKIMLSEERTFGKVFNVLGTVLKLNTAFTEDVTLIRVLTLHELFEDANNKNEVIEIFEIGGITDSDKEILLYISKGNNPILLQNLSNEDTQKKLSMLVERKLVELLDGYKITKKGLLVVNLK